MSFARAADELSISATAITYHVKQIEDHYGLSLFTRSGQSVSLTHHGQTLYEKVAISLRFIDEASQTIEGMGQRETLVVAAPVSFTLKWLMVRAHGFRVAHPEFDLRIRTVSQAREGFLSPPDVEIGFETAGESETRKPLVQEQFRPYVSADFPADPDGRSDLERLAKIPLIHFTRTEMTWQRYLGGIGVAREPRPDDLLFDRAFVALEAALCGMGALIEGDCLIDDELRAGRLRLLELPDTVDYWHCRYFLRQPRRRVQVKYNLFVDWLRQEIETWRTERGSGAPERSD